MTTPIKATDEFFNFAERYGVFMSERKLYARTGFMFFEQNILSGEAIDTDGKRYEFTQTDGKTCVRRNGRIKDTKKKPLKGRPEATTILGGPDS